MGGCAYYAKLDGPGGPWDAEFELSKGEPDGIALVMETGLPPTLPTGRYTVTLTSKLVSDVVLNGVRQIGPDAATCAAAFIVTPGQASVSVDAEFDFDTCAAALKASRRGIRRNDQGAPAPVPDLRSRLGRQSVRADRG